MHKAGYVSIIGKPNVGKSTLMNALVGEKLSIITSKAQTTRHRIMGIISGDDFQIVYSDTPGVLDPKYSLHASMMNFVSASLEDADVILFVQDLYADWEDNETVFNQINKSGIPIIFVLNKVDQAKPGQVDELMAQWQKKIPKAIAYLAVSAIENFGVQELVGLIKNTLPEHEKFFPEDSMTDRPERFFAAEIFREKIFTNYKKEVPYSTEVEIESFVEEEKIIRIAAVIYCERRTQRAILIGKGGEAIKKTGTEARLDLEAFFGKKVFLESYVKVADDWRKKDHFLKQFGYKR